MHTMHEQPGRCLGCFVVVATNAASGSATLSPRIAALAKASRPEASCSGVGLGSAAILLFFNSIKTRR